MPDYDLVLVLNPGADETLRNGVVDDVRKAVSTGGGTMSNDQDWGTRPLAFEINHISEGEYHLFQFSGPPELPAQLNRMLKITDGVLRYRVIRLRPGTPPAPEVRPRRVEAEAPAAPSAA
jgi:small subunit ribosomal protein S6